jgi:mono/diheme cytochrome c family protein
VSNPRWHVTAALRQLGRTGLALVMMLASGVALGQGTDEIQKGSAEAAVVRGGIVFRTYCVLCHGATGEGNGRTARMYNPRPANLVKSQHNDAYKEQIIRRGGEGMGRSPFMPPWGEQLTDEQIADLIQFLKSISRP